jgi:hypothetical protein
MGWPDAYGEPTALLVASPSQANGTDTQYSVKLDVKPFN